VRTLFLHLGPAKSGSTYIQTSLELSRTRLADRGIHYPSLPAELVKQGEPIFGNYRGMFDHLGAARLGGAHLLISGESLQHHLQDVDYVDLLAQLAREAGFDRIAGLFLVRDPVEHASAVYQQRVKHVREAKSIETSFALYDNPTLTLRLTRELEAVGAEITLRNYGAVRTRLLETMEEWLGLPKEELVRPDIETINRSLTYAELAIQRALNATLGAQAPRLTSRMVERLPDLVPHRPLPAVWVQEAMLVRLAPALAQLNARLPPEEPLRSVPIDPGEDSPYVFTADQIEILAEGIAEELKRRDPFFGWRNRLPGQWWGLAAQAGDKAGATVSWRSQRPDLARSVVHLTRTRGWLLRTMEAAVVLTIVGSVRRLVPMRVWSGVVGHRVAAVPTIEDRKRPTPPERSVAQAVRSAARWLPFEISCLDQAVGGSLMLRRRDVSASVVIGINRLDPTDTSHAWLVGASGAVLIGANRIDEFAPVTEFRHPDPA
jgi:hypothetical protein